MLVTKPQLMVTEGTFSLPITVIITNMSCVMRRPAFCICENKGADQLRRHRTAYQGLCFRYIGSTIPLLPKSENFKPQTTFCGSTTQFVLDLVGNAEDRFSHNMC